MTTVERIVEVCKERGIPISRLERECGFANGYVKQLKKGTMPNDRLARVADYLNISVEYLTTGEESSENYYVNPETRKLAQEIYQDPEMHMLFDAVRGSSAEEIKDFRDMILLMKRREKGD